MSDNDVMIEAQDLAAGYGDNIVQQHLDFQIMRGEVVVFLGGSGCGKSTVLKHLIGLNPPLAGRVLICGEDIATDDPQKRLAILRKFGVMYQGGALFGSMTLLENVRLPLEEFSGLPDDTIDMIARIKLDQVGLAAFAGHMPAEISGGMQKRAAIARAMAMDPDILFLDEPSAGLDPVTSAELDDLILTLARGLKMTIVMVSHELASIFAVADRAFFLDRATKTILDSGSPQDLRDHSKHDEIRTFFARGKVPQHVNP